MMIIAWTTWFIWASFSCFDAEAAILRLLLLWHCGVLEWKMKLYLFFFNCRSYGFGLKRLLNDVKQGYIPAICLWAPLTLVPLFPLELHSQETCCGGEGDNAMHCTPKLQNLLSFPICTNSRLDAFVTFIKYKAETGWAICGWSDGSCGNLH